MRNEGLCTKTGPLNCISYHLTGGLNSYSSTISGKCIRTDRNTIWWYFASIWMTWLCCLFGNVWLKWFWRKLSFTSKETVMSSVLSKRQNLLNFEFFYRDSKEDGNFFKEWICEHPYKHFGPCCFVRALDYGQSMMLFYF